MHIWYSGNIICQFQSQQTWHPPRRKENQSGMGLTNTENNYRTLGIPWAIWLLQEICSKVRAPSPSSGQPYWDSSSKKGRTARPLLDDRRRKHAARQSVGTRIVR